VAAAQLPIIDGGGSIPRVRADATRNREKILCAATTLVQERGIEHVSMDDVARAACVGTGTLYRRFGDRAGLALALLDEHTKRFQNALISGPAPLGPGAPARERLLAFGEDYLDFMDLHADLLFAALGHTHDGGAPMALYTTHLTILLREAAPHLDAAFTARALLDAVSPGAHLFARRRLEWPLARQKAGWRQLVAALSAPPAA
jgi:AcrR family transcriptional regulator